MLVPNRCFGCPPQLAIVVIELGLHEAVRIKKYLYMLHILPYTPGVPCGIGQVVKNQATDAEKSHTDMPKTKRKYVGKILCLLSMLA